MIHGQNTKFLVITAPISVSTDTAATTVAVDCLGFDYAHFIVMCGVISSVDDVVLQIEESETSGGVYVAVTNLICGTSNAIDGSTALLPVTSTHDGLAWLFDVNLAYRKRWLDVSYTTGDGGGTLLSIGCLLSRSAGGISSTTDRGPATSVVDVLRA